MASLATWSTVEGPTPPASDPWGNTRLGTVGGCQDQPEGFWPDLEYGARNRRLPGGRRGDHHPRRTVREGLNDLDLPGAPWRHRRRKGTHMSLRPIRQI